MKSGRVKSSRVHSGLAVWQSLYLISSIVVWKSISERRRTPCHPYFTVIFAENPVLIGLADPRYLFQPVAFGHPRGLLRRQQNPVKAALPKMTVLISNDATTRHYQTREACLTQRSGKAETATILR